MAENDLAQSYAETLQNRSLSEGEDSYKAWLLAKQPQAVAPASSSPAAAAPQSEKAPIAGKGTPEQAALQSGTPPPPQGQSLETVQAQADAVAPPGIEPTGQFASPPVAPPEPRPVTPWEVTPPRLEPWPQPKSERSFADSLWAGLKDFTYGTIVEGPAQFVIGGRQEFIKDFASSVNDLADWLDKNGPGFMFDKGEAARQREGRDAIAASGGGLGKLNIVGDPTTTTGHLIRSLSEFMTGMGPMSKALQAGGLNAYVASTLAGGYSMGVGSDPSKDNLTATMLRMFPSMRGTITDYLATDPNDSRMANRLRSGFEGALIGLGVDAAAKTAEGLYKTIKVASTARQAAAQQAALGGEIASGSAPIPQTAQEAAAVAAQSQASKFVDTIHGPMRDAPLVQAVDTTASATKKATGTASGEFKLTPGVPMRSTSTIVPLSPYRGPDLPFEKAGNGNVEVLINPTQKELTQLIKEGEGARVFQDKAGNLYAVNGTTGGLHQQLTGPLGLGPYQAMSANDIFKKMDNYGITNGKITSAIGDHDPKEWIAAGQRAAKLASNTDPGVPGEVLAKGIVKAQQEGSAARFYDGIYQDPGIKELGFKFNWRNFSGDDIDSAAQIIMKEMAPRIKAAGRDTITHKATSQLADDLGLEVKDLLAWQKGSAQPAEYLVAGSRLMRASADELLRLAHEANGSLTTTAEQGYALRHQFMVHAAISEKFVGAVSEAGRSLNAMKIAYRNGDVQYAKAIQDFMAIGGGEKSARDLATSLIDLERAGVGPGGLLAAARRGWWATGLEAVRESFTAGILWRPTTHIRNLASNIISQAQQAYEREMAAVVGTLSGTDSGVRHGEGAIMLYGQMTALRDAFRVAWQGIKNGDSQYAIEHGITATSKIDAPRQVISAARYAIERGAKTPAEIEAIAQSGVGRAVDYVGNAINFPFKLLAAGDDLFKVTGYSGEAHAQGLRKALGEGLSGQALYDKALYYAANPTKEMNAAALTAAKYVTFQNELGPAGNAFIAMRNRTQWPLWYVFPFIKTPANIINYGFERTPLAFAMKSVRDDIQAGGAARDIALARVASGSALLSIFFDWASSGTVTGPGPVGKGEQEAWKRTGWQPWSIRDPKSGNYFSFNSLDPAAFPLAFAASMAEMVRRAEIDPETADTLSEWTAHAAGAMTVSVLNKSWLYGMARLVGSVEDSARGTGSFETYINNAWGSMMPFGSLSATVKRMDDPTTRDVNAFWESWQAQLPILSKRLKPQRDLWGREKAPQEVYGRAYDVAIPFTAKAPTNSPIDYEMAKHGIAVADIGKHTDILGVDVDLKSYPDVKDYYERLAGNEMPNLATGKGTMDTLNEMVAGQGPYAAAYEMGSDGPHGGKSKIVHKIVSDQRQAAQMQLHAEMPTRFPEFYKYWDDKRKQTSALKLPNMVKDLTTPDFVPPQIHQPLAQPDYINRRDGTTPASRPSMGGGGFTAR